jgi:quinol monooxygenase YgiN
MPAPCVWSEPTDEESSVSDDRFGNSDTITFVATVTIKPEHETDYLAIMAAMENTILTNEPDTLLHVVHAHPTEPHTYVAIERYDDAEAVNTHADTPYFREAIGKLQDWLAKPIDFIQLRQIVPS